MKFPGNAPKEVKDVYRLLLANAMEAFGKMAEDAVYVRYCNNAWEKDSDDYKAWVVGGNFEDGSGVYLFKPDGKWYYRPWMSEVKDKMVPFDAVKGDAKIWFTG